MADELDDFALTESADRLDRGLRNIDRGMRDINRSAGQFARALSDAFAQGVTGSRSLDDVLKSLYLRLSDIALRLAFKPVENALTSGFAGLFAGGGAPVRSSPLRPAASSARRLIPAALRRWACGRSRTRSDHAAFARSGRTARCRGFRRRPRQHHGEYRDARCGFVSPLGALRTGQIARAVARGQRGM